MFQGIEKIVLPKKTDNKPSSVASMQRMQCRTLHKRKDC